MLSTQNMEFYKELGFFNGEDGSWPGVATIVKEKSGKLFRYAKSYYGPGDNFCSMWDFMDLLPPKGNPWETKYKY